MDIGGVLLIVMPLCAALGFFYGQKLRLQRRVVRLEGRVAAIARALAWGMSRNGDAPRELIDDLTKPHVDVVDGR